MSLLIFGQLHVPMSAIWSSMQLTVLIGQLRIVRVPFDDPTRSSNPCRQNSPTTMGHRV